VSTIIQLAPNYAFSVGVTPEKILDKGARPGSRDTVLGGDMHSNEHLLVEI